MRKNGEKKRKWKRKVKDQYYKDIQCKKTGLMILISPPVVIGEREHVVALGVRIGEGRALVDGIVCFHPEADGSSGKVSIHL